MKDELGRPMARLGDTTDHGGKVIDAASDLKHMGIRVALDGHGVECPKCGGVFPIVATGKRRHRGRRCMPGDGRRQLSVCGRKQTGREYR
ncbi:PAAR domain-containing protein [Paraburkholderia sediminicola]|uniref:PAAR domain-containing protein n=1 Tax=Paraburkholderia sediminicola TaxID=458836 RepID=UPI0038B8A44C